MVFEEQLGSGWLREVLFSTEMLACWGEHEDAAAARATILATGRTGGHEASENMGDPHVITLNYNPEAGEDVLACHPLLTACLWLVEAPVAARGWGFLDSCPVFKSRFCQFLPVQLQTDLKLFPPWFTWGSGFNQGVSVKRLLGGSRDTLGAIT